MRNAALGLKLLGDGVSLNGIISVSQWLSNDDFLDCADANVGTENGFFLALPSYAATAWFHHKVPNPPAQLEPWLHEVERYALGDYISSSRPGTSRTWTARFVIGCTTGSRSSSKRAETSREEERPALRGPGRFPRAEAVAEEARVLISCIG